MDELSSASLLLLAAEDGLGRIVYDTPRFGAEE